MTTETLELIKAAGVIFEKVGDVRQQIEEMQNDMTNAWASADYESEDEAKLKELEGLCIDVANFLSEAESLIDDYFEENPIN